MMAYKSIHNSMGHLNDEGPGPKIANFECDDGIYVNQVDMSAVED